MTPEKWEKAKDVFQSALALRDEARSAFVTDACAGDAEMRDEVESLIAAFQQAGSFIEAPAVEDAIKLLDGVASDSVTGQRIGPYEILNQLGRGGMGTVYLAARADEQYEKKVAIKLVKRGLDSDFIIKRFLGERQILANLEHPNIARLIDGGRTEDGSPYLVMEYVEGVSLDLFCDSQKLSITERLKIFRTVCSAIQYAHQHLVIHRDIKPSNILVTEEGTPKLLDFGIAKILSPDAAAQPLDRTATVMRLMTPDYASPEQVRGESITTSSDVYALGVLLYKLLTGHHPYRFDTPLPQEIERVVCEQHPQKPSTAITRVEEATAPDGTTTITLTPESVSEARDCQPEKLRRMLGGDLDNIVLMAMRKEPARRYSSVEQFSEDIRRHLEGLPVIARKDTFGYRTGKFIRRRRVGVAAAAVVLATLVGGIIVTAWQARVARAQRDRARLEALKSERTVNFLQDMLGAADPANQGRDVKVVAVLDEAARRIETELADQPDLAAQAHLTLGKTFMSLSLYDEAEPHLRKAFELDKQVYGEDHPTTAVAMTYLGALLDFKAKYADAEPLLRQALAIQRKAFPQGNRDLAITLYALGGVLSNKGDHKAAEPFVQEAYALSRRVFGEQNQTAAEALMTLGSIRDYEGKTDEAISFQRQAVEMFRALPKRERLELGDALMRLGLDLTTKGEYDEAESVLREALDFRRDTVGESHMLYAATLLNLARVHMYKGEHATAEKEMRQSLDIQLKFIPRGHPDLVQTISLLGLVLAREGKAAEGEPYLRESLEIRERALPKGHWLIANIQSALGECLTAEKKYVEAERFLKEGYEGLEASLGDKHPRTEEGLKRLVDLYARWKKPDLAAQYRALLAPKA